MAVIDLIAQSSELKAKSLSSSRAVNYMASVHGDGSAKVRITVKTTPGATTAVDVSTDDATCRGLYLSSSGPAPSYGSRIWGVFGDKVYRFDINVTQAYEIGTIGNNGNPVSMTNNRSLFFVVDGSGMYTSPMDHVDGAGVLTAVSLPVAPGTAVQIQPTQIMSLKQRVLVDTGFSDQFMYSDLNSSNIDPASFYTAETKSDPLSAFKLNGDLIWAFGFRTLEIWSTSDNQDNPYALVDGTSQEVGCEATYSTATIDNKIFWLGSSDVGNNGVYMGYGTSIQRISTESIEERISDFTDKNGAIGSCYASGSDQFYVLTFQSEGVTIVYDIKASQELGSPIWHDRGKRLLNQGINTYWPYAYFVNTSKGLFAGTLDAGVLASISDEAYTEYDGTIIAREFVTPNYWSDLNLMQLKRVTLDGQVGTTPSLTGPEANPIINLEISKDGGYTYGIKKPKSMGRQGQYDKQMRWNIKGMTKNVTFRFTTSTKVAHQFYSIKLAFDEEESP